MTSLAIDYVNLTRICEFARRLHRCALHSAGTIPWPNVLEQIDAFNAVLHV
jgi:hypothetical protein